MNTLIPIQYYIPVYYNILLFFTLIVFFQSNGSPIESTSNLRSKKIFGFFMLIFTLFYIGLRPVSYRFGDMVIYDIEFQDFMSGGTPKYTKDVLFEFLQYNISKTRSNVLFFFLCELFYIYPLYSFSKKMFKDYSFYAFFMLVISFSFFSFGTNGLRNGIATSLFLYAISRDNKLVTVLVLFASIFIHKSVALPIVCYMVTFIYNKPKSYLYFWILAIPVSLALGSLFQSFFLKLGLIDDEVITTYLGEFNAANEGVEIKVGFRWDFILYSASGVFAGYYFIFKRKFEDKFYLKLFNVYLMVNGFWILIIRANYSNRFAYLSWFMLAVIIIYPLLKNKFFENQHQVVARIIIIYFAFTYLLNVILV